MGKKAKRLGGHLDAHYNSALGDISNVMDAARKSTARSVNCTMTAAYWLIDRRIVESEQKGEKRAAYGEELLERLSVDLDQRFGRGFGVDNLQRFRSFYLLYPSKRICATLSRKLPDEDQIMKYATPLRISQARSTDKPDDSIFQTPSAELSLEEALIRHLETFLLELSSDFCFIGRQKRLRVGDEWYRRKARKRRLHESRFRYDTRRIQAVQGIICATT